MKGLGMFMGACLIVSAWIPEAPGGVPAETDAAAGVVMRRRRLAGVAPLGHAGDADNVTNARLTRTTERSWK